MLFALREEITDRFTGLGASGYENKIPECIPLTTSSLTALLAESPNVYSKFKKLLTQNKIFKLLRGFFYGVTL